MFILQASGPLGSSPIGPGSGYSIMPFIRNLDHDFVRMIGKQ